MNKETLSCLVSLSVSRVGNQAVPPSARGPRGLRTSAEPCTAFLLHLFVEFEMSLCDSDVALSLYLQHVCC